MNCCCPSRRDPWQGRRTRSGCCQRLTCTDSEGSRRTGSADWPGSISWWARTIVDVAHIFHGHACTPGVGFELSSDDGKGTLKVKILSLEEVDEEMEGKGRKLSGF